MAQKETKVETKLEEPKTNGTQAMVKARPQVPAELRPFVDEGFEVVSTGGATRWVDMEKFRETGSRQGAPCKGNGKVIAGILMDMQKIAGINQETGEVETRFFYNLQLVAPCPVIYKDEGGIPHEEEAKVGEVVALGERSKLEWMRECATDGGMYQILIVPHSKIPVGKGRTMWTFTAGKKALRAPTKVRVESLAPLPF